jgi:hypothetical protein
MSQPLDDSPHSQGLSEQDIQDLTTSFGPSASRVTRTPISFHDIPGMYGEYYSPPAGVTDTIGNAINQAYLNTPIIRNFVHNRQPGIHVDPAAGDWENTIRHEGIHALLNPTGQMDQLNAQNPFYQKVLNAVTAKGWAQPGQQGTEIPAWLGSGDAKTLGVPAPLSNEYVQFLQNQLLKLDPSLGKKFKQLQGKGN